MSDVKRSNGFTIVELLIVIVVIAILAAISIVAYNGIQQRAKNSQTQQAVTAWVKALRMYRIANDGAWPPSSAWTCLGSGYKWGPNNLDSPSTAPDNNQCNNHATSLFIEKADFNNAMREYVGGTFPTPAMTVAAAPDNSHWTKGIFFTNSGGPGTHVSIRAAYAGDITCPDVPLVQSVSKSLRTPNTYCVYYMGESTDPV